MPNKTIIDGIDVQDCHEWYSLPDSKLYCKISNEGDFTCKSNPNCYFKQLARAKGEIEKWKPQAELGSDTTDRLSKQLEQKEQECEELKKEKAEIKKYLGISSKTIMQRLEELQEFKDELSISEYKYKQALDDIKYACESECIEGNTGYVVDTSIILDIINDLEKEFNNGNRN